MGLCLRKAKENKIDNYKHCAVLVRGGSVLSIGLNKAKNGGLVDRLYGDKCVHAELDALCRLSKEQVKDSVLYVAGWSRGGKIICSKPCPTCQQYIKRFKLKAIYYSVPNGYEEMVI